MAKFFLFLFFFGFLLSSSASLKAQTGYRIGSEDVLQISVYEEPDLSLEVRVSSDGYITYPLLGRVEVVGLTIHELEQKLTELLEKDYLVSPQVSVIIKGYGQIYVVGEVNEPGPYPMQPNMTLMTALALAGGITDSAQDLVRVIRQGDGIQELIDIPLSDIRDKGLVEKDIKLRPHDVIQVGRSVKGEKESYVYILGQVNKPGEYLFKDKLTVVEAITLAGGLTKIAAAGRTRVIRVQSGSKKAINVNISKILKGDKKRDIVLQPDDVVMVPESFF